MRGLLKKVHPAAVFALATTIVGVLGDPAVIGHLPHRIATGVAIAGAVLQAATRAVHKGDVKEIPKPTPNDAAKA
jgi:hypothetical protein